MDCRNLIACGFVLLSVSLPSYPMLVWEAILDGMRIQLSGLETLDIVQQDFVITDLIVSGTGQSCPTTPTTQNSNVYGDIVFSDSYRAYHQSYGQENSQFNGNLNSGVLMTADSTLYLYIEADGNYNYVIFGYFTH